MKEEANASKHMERNIVDYPSKYDYEMAGSNLKEVDTEDHKI